jgi:hypothetical protein
LEAFSYSQSRTDVAGVQRREIDRKMRPDKVITPEDRQMRLPWWGVLCVILGTILLALLFVSSGRFDLARPSLISVAMIALVIVMRWKLRRHVWFWITMTFLAALHLPLICFVPWTTKWIPAFVMAPFGIADLYAMLWVLSVARKFTEKRGVPIVSR